MVDFALLDPHLAVFALVSSVQLSHQIYLTHLTAAAIAKLVAVMMAVVNRQHSDSSLTAYNLGKRSRGEHSLATTGKTAMVGQVRLKGLEQEQMVWGLAVVAVVVHLPRFGMNFPTAKALPLL